MSESMIDKSSERNKNSWIDIFSLINVKTTNRPKKPINCQLKKDLKYYQDGFDNLTGQNETK